MVLLDTSNMRKIFSTENSESFRKKRNRRLLELDGSFFFFTFSSLLSLTSQPDSPSSSPAPQHPGSICPAIPYSAFFPAEPSPAPPGRRFCLVLFPIFFLFRSSGHLFFSRNLLCLLNHLILIQDNFFYNFFFSCFYVFFHILPIRDITIWVIRSIRVNDWFSVMACLDWK